MKLEEALKKRLLRPVHMKKNGYPEAYKDEKFLDYKQLIGKTIVLVNIKGAFVITKDKDLSNITFTSDNGNSLVYIDNPSLVSSKDKPKANGFIKVTLTKAMLSADIVNLSDVYEDIMINSFAEMCVSVLDGKILTEKQLISLMVDHRTAYVFDIETLLNLTKDVELIEIVNQASPRAKLLIQEVRDGNNEPISAKYFNNKNLKKISPLS